MTAPSVWTVTVTPGSGVAALVARPLIRQAPATVPCCASTGPIGPRASAAAPSAAASAFFMTQNLVAGSAFVLADHSIYAARGTRASRNSRVPGPCHALVTCAPPAAPSPCQARGISAAVWRLCACQPRLDAPDRLPGRAGSQRGLVRSPDGLERATAHPRPAAPQLPALLRRAERVAGRDVDHAGRDQLAGLPPDRLGAAARGGRLLRADSDAAAGARLPASWWIAGRGSASWWSRRSCRCSSRFLLGALTFAGVIKVWHVLGAADRSGDHQRVRYAGPAGVRRRDGRRSRRPAERHRAELLDGQRQPDHRAVDRRRDHRRGGRGVVLRDRRRSRTSFVDRLAAGDAVSPRRAPRARRPTSSTSCATGVALRVGLSADPDRADPAGDREHDGRCRTRC